MKYQKLFINFFCIFLFLEVINSNQARSEDSPQIKLANIYHEDVKVEEYFVSEKLDGVRAYFDGKNLVSRKGNIIAAPKWFLMNFPSEHLEGELWIARGKFEEVSGIVRKEIADENNWKKVKFMLFDMPKYQGNFAQRLAQIRIVVAKSNSRYLQIINQEEILTHKDLMKKLDEVIKNGGEGLMLARKNSFYHALRNDDLLKLKTYEDSEAIVVAHIEGTGKFKGLMGALLVEDNNKIRFKIGSGFSNYDRKNPPKIGSVITYKFYGRTKNQKPRFASFIRIYNSI